MKQTFSRGAWENLRGPPEKACRCGGDGFLLTFALHMRREQSQFASEVEGCSVFLGGAIARPRPRRLPLGNGLRSCDHVAVYVWICMYAHRNCMVVSVFLPLFCVCVVFVHRRPAKSRAKSPSRVIESIFLANVMFCSFGAVPVTGGAPAARVRFPRCCGPQKCLP